MGQKDLVRFWKDPSSRGRDAASLGSHPAGLVELSDEELKNASGLAAAVPSTTALGCTEFSFRSWRRCCP